ncbi:hypothetical protein MPTK1_8g18720 [Marchantia polymorpha subsp. ruderalis]|uniref:Uncharacterized protein n=1 Tax=Marchantia polymorpha TaxID=3197 RepID=A0A2R6W868_MARPO|nr:hypothetical protein MARPO_0131s0031 [Marchantia polymorpha]BBN20390.1 hypothetical protein Mp_8g18720 [Marchantia polymorpha subsp. ruderalis]|eukprot:PTQ30037.1 hypothetical protein MARPO_0131s0031 [Marchantia polymorpha]
MAATTAFAGISGLQTLQILRHKDCRDLCDARLLNGWLVGATTTLKSPVIEIKKQLENGQLGRCDHLTIKTERNSPWTDEILRARNANIRTRMTAPRLA